MPPNPLDPHTARTPHEARPTLLGAPFDANSSFLRGAAQAPGRIREYLHSGVSNWTTEDGLDLSTAAWDDAGDARLAPVHGPLPDLEAAAERLLAGGARLLTLGGDHSITLPLARACARRFGRLRIVHIDAHADLYDELDGNRWSHACPFARILEEGLAAGLLQVGVRVLTPHLLAQVERFGVQVVRMRDWTPETPLVPPGPPDAPLYLSIDLDALDPAFAPGVAHHEPGGLSVRDLLGMLPRLPAAPAGADIVELNPARDPLGVTTAVAAKLTKEVLGRMLAS